MFLLLKNFLFTVFVPGTVAVYIPLWIAGSRVAPAPPAWSAAQVAALLPLAVGAAIYFWCLWHFAVTGRGTPAPIDAPKQLVVQGLYRYVRNPMYVGVLLVILGWALFFWSWAVLIYGFVVGMIVHSFVVLVEEPQLERLFGDSYLRYREEVGRWAPRYLSIIYSSVLRSRSAKPRNK
jgi:protein-S-isoprenylcysteine O-methyltransferase Ste14